MDLKGCNICSRLRKKLANPITDTGYYYSWSFHQLLAGPPCSGHDPLLRFLREEAEKDVLSNLARNDGKRKDGEVEIIGEEANSSLLQGATVGFDGYPENSTGDEDDNVRDGDLRRHPHIEIFIDLENGDSGALGFFKQVILAKEQNEPEEPGYGRVLDPDWMDLELAKRWIHDCTAKHGEKCRNPLKITHVSPAWLIDVIRECLTPGDGIADFVTLSYRWGSSTGSRTTRQHLGSLQRPGALNQVSCTLAPTIRHAMELAEYLGERFLWVDALCIVQDDVAESAHQLQQMGAIYASAKFTIVVADGDAMTGIPGLPTISHARHFEQAVIPIFEHERLIVRQMPWYMSEGEESYFGRAWTFQEFQLSKRRLIFEGKQLRWTCTCANWHEDLIDWDGSVYDVEFEERQVLPLVMGTPSLWQLGILLEYYNYRYLSYPEDALSGIAGFLSVLGRSFDGGFLFGLAETIFEAALMWHTHYPIKKRVPSGRPTNLGKDNHLPSWSWLSYETSLIDNRKQDPFDPMQMDADEWRIIPTTSWYTQATSEDTTDKRIIRSNWLDLPERIHEEAFELPKGWTKEVYDENRHHVEGQKSLRIPHGLGNHVYRHSSMPEKFFWLPIPFTAITEDTEPFFPRQTPFLSCDTQRGFFEASRAIGPSICDIHILDSEGAQRGELYPHYAADHSLFRDAGSETTLNVELVGICKERSPHQEESCLVLWVDWVDGIAYRRGSGRLDLSAWKEHKLDDIHLILG